MKISQNWLRTLLPLEMEGAELAELLTNLGLEVAGFEEVESIKGGLKGIVTGEVIACQKHPNADRLSLCSVDVGNEVPLSIVCGAPNVAQGQKVLVATIGTTLYNKEGETWKIKKGKIRGEISEGMICAEDELGIGDDHSGILVLPSETKIGIDAASIFQVEKDIVYEIDLTPNRSDATNHKGVAEDLRAALLVQQGHDYQVKLPDVSSFSPDKHLEDEFEVVVENNEACPRYCGVIVENIKVQPSPRWLQNRLQIIGLRSINNIVDITNFILHELGQPLHAFDLDKLEGNQIRVKTLKEGTPFVTLDGVERKLSSGDLMICDKNSNPHCIGGVFGGVHSGITESTTRLFLEAAHFDAKWIRRTSNRHLLFTDAAKLFEKGSDPGICAYALKRAALLIQELAGATVASEIIDIYPSPVVKEEITIRFSQVHDVLGVAVPKDKVKEILLAQSMNVVQEDEQMITVRVPTNKADVKREIDVIEEILRIYGFNHIPTPSKMSYGIHWEKVFDQHRLRNRAAAFLNGQGMHETMGLSLVANKWFPEHFPIAKSKLVYINNTSNRGLEVMRPSMLVSALETAAHNFKRQQNNLHLFEFGSTYQKIDDNYLEQEWLTLTISGQVLPETWLAKGLPSTEADLYYLKGVVQELLRILGIDNPTLKEEERDEIYAYSLELSCRETNLGSLGEINGHLAESFDVKAPLYYAEINWAKIEELASTAIVFEEINKYPSTRRDLALVMSEDIRYNQVEKVVRDILGENLTAINLFDVYRNEKHLGKGKKSYAISMLIEDKKKTMSDREVDRLINKLVKQLQSEFAIQLR